MLSGLCGCILGHPGLMFLSHLYNSLPHLGLSQCSNSRLKAVKVCGMVTMASKQRSKMPRWLPFVPQEGSLDECLALGGRPSCKQEGKLQGSLSHTLSAACLDKTNNERRKDTRSLAVETTGKRTCFFFSFDLHPNPPVAPSTP